MMTRLETELGDENSLILYSYTVSRTGTRFVIVSISATMH